MLEKPAKQRYRIVEAEFVISCPSLSQCPPVTMPEIAIAGRSNVGKSSLINILCNRKQLAKTSGTPGKTRLINYFRIRIEPDTHRFHLVDLPGYGFAHVAKSMQQEWQKSLETFLEQRPLRGILHLIDSRHEPTSLDLQMREWIRHKGIPSITILTKADKLNQSGLSKAGKTIPTLLQLTAAEPMIVTSTVKRTGLQELLNQLVELIKN